MLISSICNQSSFGTVCRRCNDKLIAPNGSTCVSERHIRHFWICDSCGQISKPRIVWRFVHPLRRADGFGLVVAGCVKRFRSDRSL